MIQPYLAIIHDSFREAVASRVLWILFVLVTGFLFALAVVDDREITIAELRRKDVSDWRLLLVQLSSAAEQNDGTATGRVWAHLGADVRQMILEANSPVDNAATRDIRLVSVVLLRSLNDVIKQRDLYNERAWRSAPLGEHAQTLLQQGVSELAPAEVERLNRLLLEAAFPRVIRKSPPVMVTLTALGRPLPGFSPMTRERLQDGMISVVSSVMKVLVGNVAMFVAILVTASIVPQTFSSGSLYLLLSKPISRSLLLLTKFLGGCAFVILISGYLILGMWLIVGWRFDVWQPRLLLCIPIFAFVFMIYYSVSTLAGVVYKSAIVSVVLVILLWSICCMVAASNFVLERSLMDGYRTIDVISGPDRLMRVNERNMTFLWSSADDSWRPIFGAAEPNAPTTLSTEQIRLEIRHLGPIYDAKHERLLLIPGSYGYTDVLVTSQLVVGDRDNDWKPVLSAFVPSGPRALLLGQDQEVLLVASEGVFRLSGPLGNRSDRSAFFDSMPATEEGGPFKFSGPNQPIGLGGKPAIAVDRISGAIAIYNQGVLTLLELDSENTYFVAQTRQIGNANDQLVLGLAGDKLLLARTDGKIHLLDASTLDTRNEFQPEHNNPPRFVTSSGDGRWFAVVYQHRRLVIVDAKSEAVIRRRIRGQGDISAATFSNDGKLLVADRVNRLTQYELDPLRRTTVFAPRLHWLEKMHRYVITPLYWMLPKPGELNDTIYYLLTGRESVSRTSNLASAQEQVEPFKPIASSLVFVVAVLAISCIYIERSEF